MAKGKVQHWKHGWIPITAWARAQVAKHQHPDPRGSASSDDMKAYRRGLSAVDSDDMKAYRDARRASVSSPHVDKDEERRARYAAHLAATAAKRAEQQKRYQKHLEETAAKRAATEARYLAAQNRKLRG